MKAFAIAYAFTPKLCVRSIRFKHVWHTLYVPARSYIITAWLYNNGAKETQKNTCNIYDIHRKVNLVQLTKKTQINHVKCTLRWWVGLRLSKRERERKHWDLLKRHWDQAISNWAAFPINCTLTLAIAFEQIISAINGVAVTTFGHRIFCIFMTKIQKTWAK